MSKPPMIDLTGDLSRLRQIALNHAVEKVGRHPQGSIVSAEVIECAEAFLRWLTEERRDPSQDGDGARYGIPASNDQACVTPCVAWFTHEQDAVLFAEREREVWDLVTGKRVA